MKFLNKKLIIAIFAIVIVGVGAWFSYINGIFLPVIEKIINENPEAKINTYIQAVAKGNKIAALSAWAVSPENNLLKDRKEKITNELINDKINSKFNIVSIEWWNTCCMPSVINNSEGAGGARVKVELTNVNTKHVYIFDIFTDYTGVTEGSPKLRNWTIKDIYKLEDKPLFWIRQSGKL